VYKIAQINDDRMAIETAGAELWHLRQGLDILGHQRLFGPLERHDAELYEALCFRERELLVERRLSERALS
jgi:hypothetical protein